MRKVFLLLLILLVVVSGLLFFAHKRESLSIKKLYSHTAPTREDYLLIQHHLQHGKRPFLKYLKDCESGVRKFRLISKKPEKIPQFEKICVNCSENDRQNCIILYASYNRNYPAALKRLLGKIVASDYKGHVLYRIGGWPNTDGGDLPLAQVPYAFKVCFFREAQRLGYKKILWLDTAVTPLVSFDEQFSWIQQKGYLAVGNTHTVGPFFNQTAAKALGVKLEESFTIPSASAGILGFDLSQPHAQRALELWYEAARSPHAFFSPRSDQNALSIILHQLGMTDWIDYARVAEGEEKIVPSSLYLLDRHFAHRKVSK
jgi:hypothetical protein